MFSYHDFFLITRIPAILKERKCKMYQCYYFYFLFLALSCEYIIIVVVVVEEVTLQGVDLDLSRKDHKS